MRRRRALRKHSAPDSAHSFRRVGRVWARLGKGRVRPPCTDRLHCLQVLGDIVFSFDIHLLHPQRRKAMINSSPLAFGRQFAGFGRRFAHTFGECDPTVTL